MPEVFFNCILNSSASFTKLIEAAPSCLALNKFPTLKK